MLDRDKIRTLRRMHALSQTGLANKAGLSLPTVSRTERGAFTHPHPQTVRQLATALGVTPPELYIDKDEGA